MKYLILFTLLLTLISCSKKQVPPPANIMVHISGSAPMSFLITLLPDSERTSSTVLKNLKLTTDTYDYSFYAKPGSALLFQLQGPENSPISFNVKYNGTVVVTESNAKFPEVNDVENGYVVPK